MEKLEKKMYELMYQSNNFRSANDECREIAQEVKDIAIAFLCWAERLSEHDKETSEEYKPGAFIFRRKTCDELFTDFIQTYYK